LEIWFVENFRLENSGFGSSDLRTLRFGSFAGSSTAGAGFFRPENLRFLEIFKLDISGWLPLGDLVS